MQKVIARYNKVENQALVRHLEKALAQAKAGEIRSLVMSGVLYGGYVVQGGFIAENENIYTLIGCMEAHKQDLINLNVESNKE